MLGGVATFGLPERALRRLGPEPGQRLGGLGHRRSLQAGQRLARYFGGDAASWLAMQADYDLKTLPSRVEIMRKVVPMETSPV
jgi:hypothetical protein